MQRRTKIVATWGPALAGEEQLRQAIMAGADIFRLNFSHAVHEEIGAVVPLIRSISAELGRPVALLQDIQGPRLRTGEVERLEGVELRAGDRVVVTSEDVPSTSSLVSIPYQRLADDVVPGHRVLIADGAMALRVVGVRASGFDAEVVAGGLLTAHKGVNLPDSRVTADPLTPKDRADLAFGSEIGVDYVALSFVRSAADVRACRDLLRELGAETPIVSKIEHPLAIENLAEILEASDAVMVARGDLGVEVSPERVPLLQKLIIARANEAGLPVITATQMLESMIDRPTPTRAEASDVANAILDGTDAVMLSGETAIGAFAAETIATMARIALAVESSDSAVHHAAPRGERATSGGDNQADAMARAACELTDRLHIRAMVVVTGSGRTAATLSRHRPSVPVYAFTPSPEVCRSLMLWYGVWPIQTTLADRYEVTMHSALELLEQQGIVAPGDRALFFGSAPVGVSKMPNLITVRIVGED